MTVGASVANVFTAGCPSLLPLLLCSLRSNSVSRFFAQCPRSLAQGNDPNCRPPLRPSPAAFLVTVSSLPYTYRRTQPSIWELFVCEYR